MNRVISGAFLVTLLLILQLVHCKFDTTSPTEYQSEKSRFTLTVPDDVSADLYKIAVYDSVDTVIYFSNAKRKTLQVAVTSTLTTTIIVDAIKDNTSVYSGIASVIPGEATSISLKKIENVGVVAPGNFEGEVTDDSKVSLFWNVVTGATVYSVMRSTDGSTWSEITATSDISFIDSDVETGKTYLYRIVASGQGSVSEPSTTIEVSVPAEVIDPIAPSTPASVRAQAVSMNSIEVTWKDVDNAEDYVIRYKKVTGGTSAEVTCEESVITINELDENTQYTVTVAARNSVGTSVPSAAVSCTTLSKPLDKPLVPSNVVAEALSEKSIYVTWDAVANASTYTVLYSTQANGTFTTRISSTNSFVIESLNASTTYYVKVTAANDAGTSDASDVVSAKTQEPALQAPSAPVLAVATVADTSLKVTWSAVNDASTYIIERSVTSSGSFSAICTTSALAYTDTKCSANTTYYYKGKAGNSAGYSSYSSVASGKTDAALSAPGTLTKGTVTDSSIAISWQSASGALSYKVYFSTSQNGTYEVHGTATGTQYTLNGLTAGTTYYIKVTAISGTRESAASGVLSAQTAVKAASVPSGVKATSVSATSITVIWTAVESAVSYIIYGGTSSSSLAQIGTSTSTTFSHTGLTAATTYYYAVASVNAGGTSARSTTVSAATGTAAPSTPTGLTATVASSTSITVKFNTVTGATGYKLYSSSNNNTFTLLSSLTSTNYTHSGLTANTTYYYKVSAVNGSAESAQSASVSARTSAATKVAVINSNCNGCGRCPSSCSRGAIVRSGNKYIIDASKCDGCGKCVSRCPRGAISLK
ncbi:MAG: 4Fe-4S binding protein [Fibrobacter sp.]|nr:4Fe-4S binding protein [Fibrobacter sp.]